jgi:hypothetical protein
MNNASEAESFGEAAIPTDVRIDIYVESLGRLLCSASLELE